MGMGMVRPIQSLNEKAVAQELINKVIKLNYSVAELRVMKMMGRIIYFEG